MNFLLRSIKAAGFETSNMI